MPHLAANGIELYYESTGEGDPVVFAHEFGGDARSWAPQVQWFDRWYRCITYNHRGFPPTSVPDDPDAYSQDFLIEDLRALLNHLEIDEAHLVGLSMGGNVVLNFALRYPERCRSIVVAGTGTGSDDPQQFVRDTDRDAQILLEHGMAAFVTGYAYGPTRLQLQRKDPQGWQTFLDQIGQHSARGAAYTQRGVMARRPPIFALQDRLERLNVPTLVAIGDEDTPVVESALFIKRHVPQAGLLVLPRTGHALNLEEPAAFNQALRDFFAIVERDRWYVDQR